MQALVIMSLLAQLDVFQPKFFLSLSHRKATLPGDKARVPNKMRSRENSLWSRCIRRNPVLVIHRIFTDEVLAIHTAPKASEQRRTGQSPHKHQVMILPEVAVTDGLDA